ncbi:N-acetylmuramoyl-L-alanine amidase [uncultured Desulfosarcina sp.]|uniref:N-acetylmuramoyl-L-alanine amidase n=1 Tax=uncultured Desulfosarcina sp. TaxID=218289 RepID=UPI0029C7DB99|nr:N-acetylmuramoyl-L-alanine amidase [uncultured Desulfosarcina sp.]
MQWLRLDFRKRLLLAALCCLAIGLTAPSPLTAFSMAERDRFQRTIIDYRPRLNPEYKKIERKYTRYLIVHTSELGLDTTLRVVSKGKQFRNGRRTDGGHTHYVIARDGSTYRILDKKWTADHAGTSMWDGRSDLSQMSIGIELVGYHYAPITDKQYRSIGLLLRILQDAYGLDDRAVLTHSQVAFGRPNRWHKRDHRGRKRCAKNFDRAKAGLGPTWHYDPDVRAGRLVADAQLAEVFYSPGPRAIASAVEETNLISKHNTAWLIAGEDFDSSATVYQFPDGRVFTGDQITEQVGWNRIPAKTVVLLNQSGSLAELKDDGPVKTIADGITAWSLAGRSYNHHTTIYFLPSGRIKNGSMISDWDDLPVSTRLIIGYNGPFPVSKDRSAYRIAGARFKDPQTIYYLPSKELLGGSRIEDFSRLQAGTLVFVPAAL